MCAAGWQAVQEWRRGEATLSGGVGREGGRKGGERAEREGGEGGGGGVGGGSACTRARVEALESF